MTSQTAVGYSTTTNIINNNNKPLAATGSKVMTSEATTTSIPDVVEEAQILSRSFSFESAGGVRRKIPVTPVLSTAGGRRTPVSSTAHDTLHYRYINLIQLQYFSNVVQLFPFICTDKGRSCFLKRRLLASFQADSL